jgi:hypothetical protein
LFCEAAKMDFFVYYKVQASNAETMRPRVSGLLARARHEFSVPARLMRRAEEDGEVQTWMETYENVPAEFDEWLTSASERLGIPALVSGSRHVERFVPIRFE